MEHFVHETLIQYAYSPWLVYGGIWLFMILSAFGLPLPEEVVLVSSGLVGYMAMHPKEYPPPTPDAQGVNLYVLAVVAFGAVMGSDLLIYFLGRRFGPRLFKMRWFARLVSEKALARIQRWTKEYGQWAVIIFRFTPGVRFPGHLMCGAMGLPLSRFLTIDIIAAGLSVPTQIILVSMYGKYILQYFFRFKLYLFGGLALIFLVMFTRKLLQKRRDAAKQGNDVPPSITNSAV